MTTTAQTPVPQPREPALPVRQVLGPERVRAGRPEGVAGAHRLDRPVRRVHVDETADVGVMPGGQGSRSSPSATSRGRRPNSSSGTPTRTSRARSATADRSAATALRAPTPR